MNTNNKIADLPKLLRLMARHAERKASGLEEKAIYFIQAGSSGPVKIGITRNGAEHRRAELQVGNHRQLRVLLEFPGGEWLEKCLHLAFSGLHIQGEWFHWRDPLWAFVDLISGAHAEPRQPAKPLVTRYQGRISA